MPDEVKHILICGDQGVYPGFLSLVYSFMKYHNKVHFHLFTMDITEYNSAEERELSYKKISDTQLQELMKIINHFDKESSITRYDVKWFYDEYLSKSVNRNTGFSPFAGLRLIADKILPPDIRQVLYLDADTLILGNIGKLFKTFNLTSCVFAAVKGPQHFTMNSGVLMLNMNKIRATSAFDEVRHKYNSNPYQYPDQEALIETHSYYNLPVIYNDQPFDEFGTINFNISGLIRHFTCCAKPYHENFIEQFPEYSSLYSDIKRILA